MRVSALVFVIAAVLAALVSGDTICQRVMDWANANYHGYNGLCLGFCHGAWASVGVSENYLDAPSARDAVGIAKQHAGWHNWDGNPPKGAVVLFYDCNAPTNPYGHACLSNGAGDCVSSAGVGAEPFSWYRTNYCGADPSGWIAPRSC